MNGWLRDTFTENLPLKGLALLFSVLFFGYVHGQEDIRDKTLAVAVVSLPPDGGARELMTRIPASVHVTLRGPARAINKLIQEGIAPVEVDLRKGNTERLTFPPSGFHLPSEVKVLTVDPPEIPLEWEEVITRRLPLQVSLTGLPARGSEVTGPPELDPREATVRGPISRVEVLQFARLAAFDVTGLSPGTYTRRIALDSPGPLVRYLGSQAATVTIHIAERRIERLFASLPVEVVGPAYGFSLPRGVDVTIVGPPEVITNLRPEQIVPQVDLLEQGKWSADLQHGSTVGLVSVHLAHAEARIQPPTVIVKW